VGNHKFITYVNLEQLQELVAFPKRSTYVKEGNHSSWYQRPSTGLLGGVRVEPSPPSRWSTRDLQTTKTPQSNPR
jgi:hypothetical protein